METGPKKCQVVGHHAVEVSWRTSAPARVVPRSGSRCRAPPMTANLTVPVSGAALRAPVPPPGNESAWNHRGPGACVLQFFNTSDTTATTQPHFCTMVTHPPLVPSCWERLPTVPRAPSQAGIGVLFADRRKRVWYLCVASTQLPMNGSCNPVSFSGRDILVSVRNTNGACGLYGTGLSCSLTERCVLPSAPKKCVLWGGIFTGV